MESIKPKTEKIVVKGVTARIYLSNVGKYQSFLVRYYVDGKQKSLRASTIEDAKKKAKDALADVSSGAAHVKGKAYTPKETANIEAAISKLQGVGVPLLDAVTQFTTAHVALGGEGSIMEAVRYFVADKERRKIPPIMVSKLVEGFLAEKKAGGMSLAYMLDITRRLNAFKKAFACNIGSIDAGQIAAWLHSIGASGRNANNYRNAVCTLFSFARERGYLPRGKKTEAEELKRSKETSHPIGIYTPENIGKLLHAADSALLPAIAIGAFAGLRSTEIFRLDWKHVRLDRGHIEVLAGNAKTAQRRLVPITDNLRAWLELCAKPEGAVSPRYKNITNLSRAISAACKNAGVEPVHNGLRHSFASYRLATVRNAAQVSLEMGNSPAKLFRNYRELVTPEDAEKWFAVLPVGAPENIVSIKVALG